MLHRVCSCSPSHSSYSVMSRYFLPLVHFSSTSISNPTSLITEDRFAKMRITLSRFRISSFKRSRAFVVRNRHPGRLLGSCQHGYGIVKPSFQALHGLGGLLLMLLQRLLEQPASSVGIGHRQKRPYCLFDLRTQGMGCLIQYVAGQ